MQKRLVNAEFLQVKRFASFLSELNYMKDELTSHWKLVENGEDRIQKCIDESLQLFDDLLDTIPENQIKALRNAIDDYRVAFVPKAQPSDQSVVISKEHIKALVDLAQDQCKFCVKTPEEAEHCPVFQQSVAVVPPSSYDSLICPYSQAEWLE